MYYTDIKHYLRLKEQKNDVAGVSLVVYGIALIVTISLLVIHVYR